jgi:predicted nucleotidyltransferase
VIAGDPNVQSVELVAHALGDLCDELILIGGCAASLLIDAPTAPPPRVTYDVDLLTVVTALRSYHVLEKKFAQRGFKRDTSSEAPICRWRIGAILVDLMPTEESVLGFSNRWYPHAANSAIQMTLPSGRNIHLISAPAFLATKFEAFQSRGKSDLVFSHDFEDIINVVEGRAAIVAEVAASTPALCTYLATKFGLICQREDFQNLLPGLVAYDALHTQRVAAVKQRMAAIAALQATVG